MRKLKLVPDDTHIPFLGMRFIALAVSTAMVLGSFAMVIIFGLNFGIDFRGGTMIEIGTEEPADIADLRNRLGGLGLGEVQIQEFGAPTDVLIRIETQPGGEGAQRGAIQTVRDELGDSVEYRRVEVVGPTVSGELIEAGVLAIILAVGMMLVYIWFRFEWQFSVGAVVALVHDVVITLGLFAVLQLEFNLSIIAALLTIVGYSMNDTVVVYDRVREKLRKYKRMPLAELLDLAVNKTLSRTVMTSVTTLLALLSLYIFGGEVIRGFTFAMIWGIIIGTYSSIFVAAPLLLWLGVKRDWSGAGAGEPGQAAKSAN
ncbi:Protein-export membrane protein SecF (TC 3.A.5.1.1) [Candidatus Phaeomarinobacter ectocarpi]|uniref:Protein-export membrane protein SecF n=1 Tax=Candidatus Phaeomarinibacter ectocarpi TaxID=1458461 RepID=X5MHJ3_9HYPH|nr:protein translocase subunit SecF [Candidatus Phaeomarinobacter ectocarpi]CDO61209.1 Protein-export membrane protein SecF (TC 3.A.5.1.1) [Candidatus Phaeomarinobacter ectocarpi]